MLIVRTPVYVRLCIITIILFLAAFFTLAAVVVRFNRRDNSTVGLNTPERIGARSFLRDLFSRRRFDTSVWRFSCRISIGYITRVHERFFFFIFYFDL